MRTSFRTALLTALTIVSIAPVAYSGDLFWLEISRQNDLRATRLRQIADDADSMPGGGALLREAARLSEINAQMQRDIANRNASQAFGRYEIGTTGTPSDSEFLSNPLPAGNSGFQFTPEPSLPATGFFNSSNLNSQFNTFSPPSLDDAWRTMEYGTPPASFGGFPATNGWIQPQSYLNPPNMFF